MRWHVRRADDVALQALGPKPGPIFELDPSHPLAELPAGTGERSVMVSYRGGTVLARRNADGTIDLVTKQSTWRLVESDGTTTWLRPSEYSVPTSGMAYAFLGAPPADWTARSPWQLRIATPRENIDDARLLRRRDRQGGAVLVVMSAVFAGIGSVGLYLGARSEAGPVKGVPLGLGIASLSGAGIALGFALHNLLAHERDEPVVPPTR
jgi:hypothetical protein